MIIPITKKKIEQKSTLLQQNDRYKDYERTYDSKNIDNFISYFDQK